MPASTTEVTTVEPAATEGGAVGGHPVSPEPGVFPGGWLVGSSKYTEKMMKIIAYACR